MKNFVFAFLLFPLFVACNGQSKPEKENISDETQSVLSNEPENVPVHLNKVQFLDKVADYEKNPDTWVYRGDKPAIIDFYATWCGPCKVMSPTVEAVGKELIGQARVLKIDVDKNEAVANLYRIQSVPTLIIFKRGEVVWRTSGVMEKSALIEQIKKFTD